MKKVFMSIAIVAICLCAASCGNNANKAAEEKTCECTECCDSCKCACADTLAAAADSVATEVVETIAQ